MVASLLKSGGISLDLEKCRARVGRRVVDLTLTEYNLLVCLVKNAGHPLSRRELLDAAWDQFYQGSERTVDTHVGRLRQKLGRTGRRIRTLRGMGYQLEMNRRK